MTGPALFFSWLLGTCVCLVGVWFVVRVLALLDRLLERLSGPR